MLRISYQDIYIYINNREENEGKKQTIKQRYGLIYERWNKATRIHNREKEIHKRHHQH